MPPGPVEAALPAGAPAYLPGRVPESAARVIARSLVPHRLPPSDELEVAGRWQPGRDEVGGDWYDVVALGAGRLGVAVGDVMGRGVGALSVTAQLRAAVRTCARLDLPPEEVLAVLDGLVADLAEDVIASCAYGVFDPHTRELALAAAGAPPPVLRSPAGGAGVLGLEPGLPLGLGDAPRQVRVPLPPGAVLALYSDGLVQGSADPEAGVLRVAGALLHGPEALDPLADALVDGLRPAGGRTDDVALLLLRVPLDVAARSSSVVLPVPRERRGFGEVRGRFRDVLQRWALLPEVAEAAVVLAAELATNALVHGKGRVEVRLRLTRDRLVVEVADEGSHMPRRRRARAEDEDGRGLQVVARIATRWGARLTDDGKLVWAELDLAAL